MIIPGGQKRRHIGARTEEEREQEGKSFLLPLWQRYQVHGISATRAKYWFSESEWDQELPWGTWSTGGRGPAPAWIRTAQTWLTSSMNVWLRLGKEPTGKCSKPETWRTEVALLRWSGYGCRPVRRACRCPPSERWQFWGTWRHSSTPTWSGEEVGQASRSAGSWF